MVLLESKMVVSTSSAELFILPDWFLLAERCLSLLHKCSTLTRYEQQQTRRQTSRLILMFLGGSFQMLSWWSLHPHFHCRIVWMHLQLLVALLGREHVLLLSCLAITTSDKFLKGNTRDAASFSSKVMILSRIFASTFLFS